jgi:hypothetical protein
MSGKGKGTRPETGKTIGPALTLIQDNEDLVLDGQLTVTRDKAGLALARDLQSALSAAASPMRGGPAGDQTKALDTRAFAPFADEVAALSLSGLTVENHLNRIDLWGRALLASKGIPTTDAMTLIAVCNRIVETLESAALPDNVEGDAPDAITTARNPFS